MSRQNLITVLGILLILGTPGCGSSTVEPDASSADAFVDEEFEWPAEPPELVATLQGHWTVCDGDLYLDGEEKKDDIGFAYRAGVFVPKGGPPIEFQWDPNPDAFGELQEGVNYYYESMLHITCDEELPFTKNGAPDVRFRVGEVDTGLFSEYEDDSSMERTEFTISRVDDRVAP